MLRRSYLVFGLLGLAAVGSWASYRAIAQEPDLAAAQQPDQPDEEGVEVLARGPIHEAFAQPLTGKPEPSPVFDKKPPEPIEELPPEAKPEGDATWIPGYWAWDDERKDYIWISGAWRVSPPDQRFVPGYWAEVDGGWQWVPGFWTTIQTQEVEYLPEAPPESLDEGPSTPAPDDDHFWIPGNWSYNETRYAWKPGYWAEVQPHWVWVPARYTWCPSGWVYTSGYWDYPFVSRGWLFSPVYFTSEVYTRPNYYYRPRIVLSTVALSTQLFVRPHWNCYYFGDFYAPSYIQLGYHPWHHWGRRHYDPIYSYQRWYYHKRDRDWDRSLDRRYDYLARNADARPPRVVNITNINNTRINIKDNDLKGRFKDQQMAFTLNDFTSKRKNVERIPEARQKEFRDVARDLQQFRRQRTEQEIKTASTFRTNRDLDPAAREAQRRNRDGAERSMLKLPSLSAEQQARVREQAERRGRDRTADPNRIGQNRGDQNRTGQDRTGRDRTGSDLRDAIGRSDRTGNDAARRAREEAAGNVRPGRQGDTLRDRIDDNSRPGRDRTTRPQDITGQPGQRRDSAIDRGAADRAADAARDAAQRQRAQVDRAREQSNRAAQDRQRAQQDQARDATRNAAQDRARNAQREAQQNQQREAQQRSRDQQRDAQRAVERQRGNQGIQGQGGGRDGAQRRGRDRDDKAMIDAQRDAAQQAAAARQRDAGQQAARERQRDATQQAAVARQRDAAQQAARERQRDAGQQAAVARQRDAAQEAARDRQRDAAQQAARDRQRDAAQQAARERQRDVQQQARQQQQNQARAEQANQQRQQASRQQQQAARQDAARAVERRTAAREVPRDNPRGGGDRGNRQKDKDKDKDQK